MTYAHGIDVSNHQQTFDWAAYPGIDFAFIKAVEQTPQGMYYDTEFPRNWQQAHDRYDGKLVRGAYCYAHPGEALAPQVDALLAYTREHGLLGGDHFVLDLETTDGQPPAEVSRFGRAFCASVNRKAPGCRCLPYTYPAFAEAGNCADLGGWRLYIANYQVSTPTVPAPWKTWHFWQFEAGQGTAPDRDVFNGDRALLLDFARMPANRR